MSLKRRDFLKIVTFVATLPSPLLSLVNKKDRFVYSTCEMCSSRCAIQVRQTDEKVTYINGNDFDKSIQKRLCARGVAGVSQLYDKKRITKPLIRVGARGEGKWREASWDEALKLVTKKLLHVKENFGAQSVLFSSKTGENYDLLHYFSSRFGSPNIFSHYSSCPVAIEMALSHTFGEKLERDFKNTNYILNFGHNLFEGIDVAYTNTLAHFCNDPKKKLVVLEPRFSVLGAKAHEWHPVKAGGDLAFVLALLHVWLRDGKFNAQFVQKYTIGLDELRVSTKDTTPLWQESFTGISSHVVEKVADELWQNAPKCIIDWGHKSTTTKAEYQRSRAIMVANVLMGNVEKEGGIFFIKTPNVINNIADEKIIPTIKKAYKPLHVDTVRIDGAGEEGEAFFVSREHGVLTKIHEAINEAKPYPIKAWFLTRHNPLMSVANANAIKESMNKLDFIVVNDLYLSQSAMMADVVLPECTYLEQTQSIRTNHHYEPVFTLRNKSVEPVDGCLSFFEVIKKLSKSLNQEFEYEDIKSVHLYQSNGNVKLLEQLYLKGVANFGLPQLFVREKSSVDEFRKKYKNSKNFDRLLQNLKTPSGKIELYCHLVEQKFPTFGAPAFTDMQIEGEGEFTLLNGKSAIHTNGHTQFVPDLVELMSTNHIWINPKTAKRFKLKTGDKFYLQNEFGKEEATAFITQGVDEKTLFAYMGYARPKGANLSALLSSKTAQVCCSMTTNIKVDIKR